MIGAATPALATIQAMQPRFAARQVVSIGMTVTSLNQSILFYRQVLGFALVSRQEVMGRELQQMTSVAGARAQVARLQLGTETLQLTEYLTPRGKPVPPNSRSNDHWFQHVAIVVRDMDAAYARLLRYGVEHASVAPQRLPDWNASAGGIRAFYFRDHDGHFLELLQFPDGKGHAKWHLPNDGLFLGIDHTAIVVRSTEASLRVYRDALGMRIVGESLNFGPEQERLSGVPGARVRITTLRASAGPGIELLEYLSPKSGRPRPTGARPNDLLHWHTTIAVEGLDRKRVVTDPDGHVIELAAYA